MGRCYQSYQVQCENVDRICAAKDREDGQSAVVVGMNFGVW